jgi:hypothetical protein
MVKERQAIKIPEGCGDDKQKLVQTGAGNKSEEVKGNAGSEMVLVAPPLAIYDPTTDTILQLRKESSERSEPDEGVMTTQEDPTEVSSVIPSDFFLVHTEGGGRELMHKSKWPRLMTPGDKQGGLGRGNGGCEREDTREGGETAQGAFQTIPKSKPAREVSEQNIGAAEGEKRFKQKYHPTVASRRSARGGPATSTTFPGMINANNNPFLVLDTFGDDDLVNLALDCDINLGENHVEVKETIEAMKLEEIARAAVAEALHIKKWMRN